MSWDDASADADGMVVTFGEAVLLGQARAYTAVVLFVDDVGLGLVVDFLADEKVRAVGDRTDDFGAVWRDAYESLTQVVEARLASGP